MKNLIITFIISRALLASIPSLAQVEKADTIQIGKTRIITKNVDSTETGVTKELLLIEGDESKDLITSWFNLKVGWTNWLNESGNLGSDNNFPLLEISPAQSFNLQVNIIEQSLKLNKDRIRLIYGIGFDNYYYRLKNDISLSSDQNGLIITDESATIDFKKNWVTNSYVTIPLLLNFNFALNKGKKKDFQIFSGVNLMYAMRSSVKQKWREDGLKYKREGKQELGVNQLNIGYEAQLGYKNFILYGKYFPDGIFKSASDPNLRSVSFGIVNFFSVE
ncbi:MAG: outer membrane beta-barrel protein [Bacteroidia bacterium]|nr:outer membrane beta-barrel protein [Bacteroidia bacterium]